jgi:hypothetical protein
MTKFCYNKLTLKFAATFIAAKLFFHFITVLRNNQHPTDNLRYYVVNGKMTSKTIYCEPKIQCHINHKTLFFLSNDNVKIILFKTTFFVLLMWLLWEVKLIVYTSDKYDFFCCFWVARFIFYNFKFVFFWFWIILCVFQGTIPLINCMMCNCAITNFYNCVRFTGSVDIFKQ